MNISQLQYDHLSPELSAIVARLFIEINQATAKRNKNYTCRAVNVYRGGKYYYDNTNTYVQPVISAKATAIQRTLLDAMMAEGMDISSPDGATITLMHDHMTDGSMFVVGDLRPFMVELRIHIGDYEKHITHFVHDTNAHNAGLTALANECHCDDANYNDGLMTDCGGEMCYRVEQVSSIEGEHAETLHQLNLFSC